MTFEEFKQIDFRDPGRWPLSVRLGVIGLFFVVVATALLIFLVWNAKKDELASLENKEQELRTQFRTKHGRAVNLELYQQQLADIRKQFGTQVQQLPGKSEMDRLLEDISLSATQSGLEVTQFDPQESEQNRDFYAERPIKIRVAGSYHQMGEFASAIAALSRIVTLHDVSIRAASNKSNAYDQLVMNVTARTYRYLDEEEIAAANAARKKQAGKK